MGREQQRRGMRNEEVHGWGISSNIYWAEKEREKKQSGEPEAIDQVLQSNVFVLCCVNCDGHWASARKLI